MIDITGHEQLLHSSYRAEVAEDLTPKVAESSPAFFIQHNLDKPVIPHKNVLAGVAIGAIIAAASFYINVIKPRGFNGS